MPVCLSCVNCSHPFQLEFMPVFTETLKVIHNLLRDIDCPQCQTVSAPWCWSPAGLIKCCLSLQLNSLSTRKPSKLGSDEIRFSASATFVILELTQHSSSHSTPRPPRPLKPPLKTNANEELCENIHHNTFIVLYSFLAETKWTVSKTKWLYLLTFWLFCLFLSHYGWNV